MAKTVSFVRVNKYNAKYVESQKNAIEKYLKKSNIELDEQIEIEVNFPKEEENIINLLKSCTQSCTVIVSDLNVFGRTTEVILEILKYLLKKKVRVISVNQNLDLIDDQDMLTQMILGVINMTINLEKELMSLRTKEALNAKKVEGIHLGKPKGTIQKSKFDKQRDKIEELLSVGLSVRKIAKLLGYNNHIGLNNYVKKRNIRVKVDDASYEEDIAS
ncbi:MAG: recombinase family protein [Sulfurimonadaceae bacterium]|jgi:DNA invertase Pin-like site-specific DNA recombinase|nr:recombinase family protein [Arcobacteraceae bacterium]MDX9796076.1 recombinase family protein [Arcobacteraceae bacterium]